MKLDKMSEAVVTRLWTTGSQRPQSLREEMCEVGPTVPQPSALGQFPVHGTGWEKSVYGGPAELRRQRPEFGAAEVAGTFRVQRGERCRDGVAEDGGRYPWILSQALGCYKTEQQHYQESHWWETLELQPSRVETLLKTPVMQTPVATPESSHL